MTPAERDLRDRLNVLERENAALAPRSSDCALCQRANEQDLTVADPPSSRRAGFAGSRVPRSGSSSSSAALTALSDSPPPDSVCAQAAPNALGIATLSLNEASTPPGGAHRRA